jgi:preprotein translocase subunit SecF
MKMKINNMKTRTSIYLRHFAYVMLCLVLLSSCSGHIVVWNIKDIIGLIIFGILILILGSMFIYAWIVDSINEWKRKRKKKL